MKTFIGEGGLDDNDIFNYYDENNIQPIIKLRKNSSPKSREFLLRRNRVRKLEMIGKEEGIENYNYGRSSFLKSYFSTVLSYVETVSAKRSTWPKMWPF